MNGPWLVIRAAWIAIVLVWLGAWLVGRREAKPTAEIQDRGRRQAHVLALAVTALLMLAGPRAPLYQPGTAFQWCGAILAMAGCSLAITARIQLGANWSPHATLKGGQELLQSGAYALSRHPIYTGILALLAGNAAALGQLRGALALALLAYSLHQKAKAEEAILQRHFGVAYSNYRGRVGRLIPLIG